MGGGVARRSRLPQRAARLRDDGEAAYHVARDRTCDACDFKRSRRATFSPPPSVVRRYYASFDLLYAHGLRQGPKTLKYDRFQCAPPLQRVYALWRHLTLRHAARARHGAVVKKHVLRKRAFQKRRRGWKTNLSSSSARCRVWVRGGRETHLDRVARRARAARPCDAPGDLTTFYHFGEQ